MKPDYANMSIEQHRAAIEESREEVRRSTELYDTDAFITNWCHGLTQQLHLAWIKLKSNGGVWDFETLVDAETGEVVSRCLEFRYCKYSHSDKPFWKLGRNAARYGRTVIPAGKRSRIQKQLGLKESTESAPAYADTWGTGQGLSGNVHVTLFREDDERPDSRPTAYAVRKLNGLWLG